jgi:alkanesulfonate monooxygenase SsuD/methylene tetrahydromethanopterin reductase-like flavin-dependent oxidoreductase (luciferase family)
MQDMRARYEEALEILERAWTQERFSYEGQFWQIPEIALSPKPLQKPHPPLYRAIVSPEAFEPAGAKGHGALFVPWFAPAPRLKVGDCALPCRPTCAWPVRGVWDMITSMADHLEERAIIGTPRDCRRRLAEVREEWGIQHIVFYLHAGARDITRTRQGLELFAKEVTHGSLKF